MTTPRKNLIDLASPFSPTLLGAWAIAEFRFYAVMSNHYHVVLHVNRGQGES